MHFEGRIFLNLLLILEMDNKFGFTLPSFYMVNIITLSYPSQHERMLLCHIFMTLSFEVCSTFMKINKNKHCINLGT